MPPWLISSIVVFVLASTIPPTLTALVRRRNARDRVAGVVRNRAEDGGLLARPRWFQYGLALVVGYTIVVVGILVGLTAFAEGDDWIAPVLVGAVLVLLGVGMVLIGESVRRTRITVYPDRLEVGRGLRRRRTVPLTEIAEVRPWRVTTYPGMDGRDERGRKLFAMNALAVGYEDLERVVRTHLAERDRPTAWAAVPRPDAVR